MIPKTTPSHPISAFIAMFPYCYMIIPGIDQEYFRIDFYIVGFEPVGNRLIIGGRFDVGRKSKK